MSAVPVSVGQLTWRATAIVISVSTGTEPVRLAKPYLESLYYFWLKNLLYLSVVHVITARLLMQYRTV